ncbi:MAG: hypothetical protein AAF429_05035 [Pseudomonadota bacterium]
MNLLFRRNQTNGYLLSVTFRLWGKIELDAEEQKLVRRYELYKAMVIEGEDPDDTSGAWLYGFVAAAIVFGILYFSIGPNIGTFFGVIIGTLVGYWKFHKDRETIFVRDLMHGRYFSCTSINDLARKEKHLRGVCNMLKQTLESCKHWDGTESLSIKALPIKDAKDMITL